MGGRYFALGDLIIQSDFGKANIHGNIKISREGERDGNSNSSFWADLRLFPSTEFNYVFATEFLAFFVKKSRKYEIC